MLKEEVEVRVARVEERVQSLEHWRDVLDKEIDESRKILAAMDEKLDRTLDASQKRLPAWADYMIWLLIGLLGLVGGVLTHPKL